MSNCKRRVSIPSPQEIDPCDGTKYPTECVIESNALVNLGLPENSSQQEINLVLDTAIYNLSSAVTTPVQDKGTQVVDSPSALNFTGDAITVTDVGGVATINVSTLVPSSDYISNVELTGQNLVFTGIGNAFDSPVDLSSLDSTGYESVTEEGNTGLRRVGADVVNHGSIGNRALDLGYQTSPSDTRGATGTGAINLGQGGTASASFSFNTAISGTASNTYAVNLGQGGTASGVQSLNAGQAGVASGLNSINLLDGGQALGDYSINLVRQGIAASFKEIVLGSFPTNYTPNALQTYNLTDRLFTLGIGINDANLADGITVLKNGQIGIGINNFEDNSTGERLQVNGTIKATTFVGDGSGLTGLPSVGTPKHIELLGDGAALTYNIFHEKGTRSLHFSLFNITTGKYDEGDYTYVDDDNTLVTFATAPTLNQYEISII